MEHWAFGMHIQLALREKLLGEIWRRMELGIGHPSRRAERDSKSFNIHAQIYP